MKQVFATILLVMSVLNGPDAIAQVKKVYDEEINTLEQVDAAVAKAGAEGKFVICQVGGNWCPWCLRFADFITKDAEIAQFVDRNFVYIHVNYSPRRTDSEEKVKITARTMERLGNPGRFGYPVLVVLDGDGKVIHIQDTSFLEEGEGYDKAKVMRFFKGWTPEAVK